MLCLIVTYLRLFSFPPVINKKRYLMWFQSSWIYKFFLICHMMCLRECSVHVFLSIACSAAVGWNGLCIPVRSVWSKMRFKSNISLLTFCLNDLSFWKRAIWSALLLLYHGLFIYLDLLVFSSYWMYECNTVSVLHRYIFMIAISSWWIEYFV